MAGTVRVSIDGQTYTAHDNYYVMQHSGDPGEFRDFTPDWAWRAIRSAGHGPRDAEGGLVTVVVDGQLVSIGVSKWPDSEEGSADRSGFGFGGLDANLDILNYGYTAERSFSVRRAGRGEYADEWVTHVDGEVVERGEMRPFRITWKARGAGSVPDARGEGSLGGFGLGGGL